MCLLCLMPYVSYLCQFVLRIVTRVITRVCTGGLSFVRYPYEYAFAHPKIRLLVYRQRRAGVHFAEIPINANQASDLEQMVLTWGLDEHPAVIVMNLVEQVFTPYSWEEDFDQEDQIHVYDEGDVMDIGDDAGDIDSGIESPAMFPFFAHEE